MKSLTPIHRLAKSDYCVIRVNHSSTALIPGLSSQYVSFEIVKAAAVNKAGVVTKAETEAGWTTSKWEYLYAIPEFQAEADRMFGNGDTSFDSLSAIKNAITATKQQLENESVMHAENHFERSLELK